MHDEFMNLTGITVSYTYYHRHIEPLYVACADDKATFCAAWVKTNRNDIGKALRSDIERMSIKEAMDAVKIEQLTRQFRRQSELAIRWETIAQNVSQKHREVYYENERLIHAVKSLEMANNELATAVTELDELKKSSAEKDHEIIRLKAMLFDLMQGVA